MRSTSQELADETKHVERDERRERPSLAERLELIAEWKFGVVLLVILAVAIAVVAVVLDGVNRLVAMLSQ